MVVQQGVAASLAIRINDGLAHVCFDEELVWLKVGEKSSGGK
jgi:hypothetical protein